MQVLNDTPFPVLPIFFKVQPRQPVMTILTKGLFVLQKDGVCWPAPVELQAPPLPVAVQHEDDFGNSVRTDAETAPYKPRADCLLLGSAHAPVGRTAEALSVTFSVGPMTKTLWVYGDRYWVPRADGSVSLEGPETFTTMPIRNEFAAGGIASAYNKHGLGLINRADPDATKRPIKLPNIQAANETRVDPNRDSAPEGFGPLDSNMRPRRDLAGTYDDNWFYRRKPLPPLDFSFDFYNAARRDQQVDGYLRGDEPIYAENLHREHLKFHSQLPGIRLRYFLIRLNAAGKPSLVEAGNHLDTCMVDMDEESVTLLWRGRVPVDPAGREQYSHVYVGQEPLDAPRDTAFYRARIKALLMAGVPAPPPPPEPSAEEAAKLEKDLAEADRKTIDEALALMEKAKAPPEMMDLVKGQTDPMKVVENLMKYADNLVKNLPKPPG